MSAKTRALGDESKLAIINNIYIGKANNLRACNPYALAIVGRRRENTGIVSLWWKVGKTVDIMDTGLFILLSPPIRGHHRPYKSIA